MRRHQAHNRNDVSMRASRNVVGHDRCPSLFEGNGLAGEARVPEFLLAAISGSILIADPTIHRSNAGKFHWPASNENWRRSSLWKLSATPA
jgi:hypothetical protein